VCSRRALQFLSPPKRCPVQQIIAIYIILSQGGYFTFSPCSEYY